VYDLLITFRKEIAQLVADAAGTDPKEVMPTIEVSKVSDLACKYPFILAKQRKENPAKISSDLCKKIETGDLFAKVESAGPYINFYFSSFAYSKILEDIISKKERFGAGDKKNEKLLIEFPSVNPNKPWHIGHLRNAILGNSVARILEFDGKTVERMDYIDDLGLQVAQSLWGVMNLGAEPEGKFDNWLGQQYVEVSKKFETDPKVADSVRNILKKMEEGNNEVATKGRELAENCVKAQYETSFNFGIYHDVLVFESDIMHTLFKEGVEFLKTTDAVILEQEGKNIGCWVVKLTEDFGFGKLENPDKILIRSDGTAVYTGKDVIFHLWKFGKLKNKFNYQKFLDQPNNTTAFMTSKSGEKMDFANASSAINVIGVEQKYPQKVIVEVFKRLGFDKDAESLKHLSYEHVGLPEAKFSGRAGTWVGFTADALFFEACSLVKEKIKLDVPDSEKEMISKLVGASAIKFALLKTSSDKRITFKWEEALSLEGDSGPYAQYAYVRTNGILGKTKEKPEVTIAEFNPSEKELIKKLAQLSEVVSRCSKELAPHHLSQYSLEVAAGFSSFYANSHVLNEKDEKIRKSRLAITLATAIVLKNSLYLLGIDCPKRM
jgi:arginyl-tRNA synthetase